MKVLIVGFGSVGKKHYQALCKIDPSVNLVALRSNYKAGLIENVHSVFSIEEVFNNAPFDFAIISNPTNKHEETIENLLPLNCPLFIEKPVFNVIQSDSLLKAIHSAGIKTYVACNLRFLDSIKFLKYELLPELRINEVNVYCGSYLPDWRQGIDYKTIYSAHSDQGGGVDLDLIHEIDYTWWLFGRPLMVNSYKRSKSTLGIDAVDYANYLLEYDTFAVNLILNYYRRDKKRTIELVCTDETYTVDLNSNSVFSTKGEIFKSPQTISDTYLRQLEYFIGMISDHDVTTEVIMNNINEAFEVLKISLNKWN